MIVLDTNVISTMLSTRPDEHVLRWLDAQPTISIWTTSVTVFEIRLGLEQLPQGRRRVRLMVAFEQFLDDAIGGRVLPLDNRAALCAAQFAVRRRTSGRPVDIRDTLIAGVVIAQRGTLATRNLRHFDDPSLQILDPFDPRAVEPDARWVQAPPPTTSRRRVARTMRS